MNTNKTKITSVIAGIITLTSFGYVSAKGCDFGENPLRLSDNKKWCLTDSELSAAKDFLIDRIELSTSYDLERAISLVDYSADFRKLVRKTIDSKDHADEDDYELRSYLDSIVESKIEPDMALIREMIPN